MQMYRPSTQRNHNGGPYNDTGSLKGNEIWEIKFTEAGCTFHAQTKKKNVSQQNFSPDFYPQTVRPVESKNREHYLFRFASAMFEYSAIRLPQTVDIRWTAVCSTRLICPVFFSERGGFTNRPEH